MADRGGLVGRVLQEVEHRAGVRVVSDDRLEILEQAFTDLRATWRELDLLGYTALDYLNANPSELRPETRRTQAKKGLVAWMHDPQAARAVSTLNDFTFGRGVPQPRAKDKAVQEILDEFWNDRDNKILVTSHEGQVAMGTDLSIQSNLFPLIFDDGRDGKVKVGLLEHDSVEDVVRDENNRLRILYYVARERKVKWDYKTRRYVRDTELEARPKMRYYEHWANVRSLEDDGETVETPPTDEMGVGRVYHLVVNKTTEMAFGVPEMQRVLRWFAAYNDFMAARVDMMKAAAAFIMKRKIKGTPNQLAKMATKAISRQSPLAGLDTPDYPVAGRAAAIVNENDLVSHEAMKIDSGAGQAAQDAAMLHGQIAAGVGLPKHYLGEPDANLATATALELPVLKMVESRQEVFEQFYRALFDMVIEKAVDDGRLDKYGAAEPEAIQREEAEPYLRAVAARMVEVGIEDEAREKVLTGLREGLEDQAQDEQQTERDLSYEFSMPSPLRRQMVDLVGAVQTIAQTFDPNNTNVELSRALLAIALGEGLEVDNPADLVDKILPEGYVDPMLAMAQQQQAAAAGGGNTFGPGAEGQPMPPSLNRAEGGANAGSAPGNRDAGADGSRYGARMKSRPPEQAMEGRMLTLRGRDGSVLWHGPLVLTETRDVRPDEDEDLVVQVRGHSVGLDALFDNEVGAVALAALNDATLTGGNGTREET